MKNAQSRLPARIEIPRNGKRSVKTLRGLSNCPRIKTSADVATAFCPIANSHTDVFVAGLLDSNSRLIAWQIVSVGSPSRFAAKVQDLFGLILGKDGHQVVFAFSGKGMASSSELDRTEDILSAAAILGVSVFDVVKITSHGHLSLKGQMGSHLKGMPTIALASACA